MEAAARAGPSRFSSGHRAVGERQLTGVGRLPAELVQRRGDLVAGRPVLDDEVRDLVLARAGGDRHAPGQLGAGVRDEHLRAVDDPRAVAQLGGRPRRARVRAGVRLGQPEGGEPPAGGEVGQPAVLLLVGAEQEDRHRPERRVRRDRDRDRRVDRASAPRSRSRSRPCRRPRRRTPRGAGSPCRPSSAISRTSSTGKRLSRSSSSATGRDALARERADGVADQLLLGREVEIHAGGHGTGSQRRL